MELDVPVTIVQYTDGIRLFFVILCENYMTGWYVGLMNIKVD